MVSLRGLALLAVAAAATLVQASLLSSIVAVVFAYLQCFRFIG